MRLGIVGGTFDPIHNGHLYMGEQARHEYQLDGVLYIPNGHPPHKDGVVAGPVHRLEMARLAVANNPSFDVFNLEGENEKPHFTVDSLQLLKSFYPDTELFYIIGQDTVSELITWRQYEQVFSLCTFLVITRQGADLSCFAPYPDMARLRAPGLSISSTIIRKLIKKSGARYLVPDSVLDYIEAHKLYL